MSVSEEKVSSSNAANDYCVECLSGRANLSDVRAGSLHGAIPVSYASPGAENQGPKEVSKPATQLEFRREECSQRGIGAEKLCTPCDSAVADMSSQHSAGAETTFGEVSSTSAQCCIQDSHVQRKLCKESRELSGTYFLPISTCAVKSSIADTYTLSDAFDKKLQSTALFESQSANLPLSGISVPDVYESSGNHVMSTSESATVKAIANARTLLELRDVPSTMTSSVYSYLKTGFPVDPETSSSLPDSQREVQLNSSSDILDGCKWIPQMESTLPKNPPPLNTSDPDTTISSGSSHGCNMCHKTFRQQASLLVHMRVHSGDRPYKCCTCGKTFQQAANLTAHQRTHTGERPYECVECGKKFTQQGNLMTHKRVHSKEKPFECNVCHKCFSQAGNLKTHQRIHSGQRPYQCQGCSISFTQLSGLQSHRKSKHGTKDASSKQQSPTSS